MQGKSAAGRHFQSAKETLCAWVDGKTNDKSSPWFVSSVRTKCPVKYFIFCKGMVAWMREKSAGGRHF